MNMLKVTKIMRWWCVVWLGYDIAVYVGDMTWRHRPYMSWIPVVCAIVIVLLIRLNTRTIMRLKITALLDEVAARR